MGKIILSAFADEYSSDFTEQLVGMRSFGIDYIEMRGVDGKNVSLFTPNEVKEAKEKLAFYGIDGVPRFIKDVIAVKPREKTLLK